MWPDKRVLPIPLRRNLLLGNRSEIRPPWAMSSESFFEACTGCKQCQAACPTSIIYKDHFAYPLLDFNRGECLFCRKCLDACPTEALSPTSPPWNYRAYIDQTCLAIQGTVCRLCGEMCEQRALSFPPQIGGIAPPKITLGNCTGCGACVSSCPVHAVSIRQNTVTTR